MTGTPRTRQKVVKAGGHCIRYTPQGSPPTYVLAFDNYRERITKSETITDVVGDRTHDHNLLIEKFVNYVTPLNGDANGLGYRIYRDYPGAYFDLYTPSHASGLGLPSESSALTTAIALSNPNRAKIDLPIAVAELRDVPGLVMDYGSFMMKRLKKKKYRTMTDSARQNLAWQFGLAPMIKDIQSMLDFYTLVQKRYEEIEQLYESGGLRRRVTLVSNMVKSEHARVSIDSNLSDVINRSRSRRTVVNRWATMRWKPKIDLPKPKYSHLMSQAYKSALGMQFDAVTAWELMPWSWLIDWFSTTGAFIQNTRNIVRCELVSACLMTQYDTYENYATTPRSVDLFQGAEGQIGYTTKKRYASLNSVLDFSIGLIDWRKTSILGSLAISKSRNV